MRLNLRLLLLPTNSSFWEIQRQAILVDGAFYHMWTPRLFRLQIVSRGVPEKFTANSPLPRSLLRLTYERGKFEGSSVSLSTTQKRQEPLEVALLRATCDQYSMSGREQGYRMSSVGCFAITPSSN